KKGRKRRLKNIFKSKQDQRLFEYESNVYIIDDELIPLEKRLALVHRNSRHWSGHSKHIIKKLSDQINSKELEIHKQSNIIKQLEEKMSKVSVELIEVKKVFGIENNACILEAICHYNWEYLIENAVIPFECSKQSSCDHIQSLEYFEESKSCGDCNAESENYIVLNCTERLLAGAIKKYHEKNKKEE
ncbi:hypothetical protein RFI_35659, partial [Reticulomyxa filosa]